MDPLARFTPLTDVDEYNTKDWPVYLGKLDWDTTSIVFTKRSLLEFLRTVGVTVEPGLNEIQKLPREVSPLSRQSLVVADSGR